mgnify:CR=1 FL=1
MRKRTIHKAAAALTALALCAGVLTGCGGAASSTTASSTAGSAASSEVSGEEADELAAKNVADLIDAIYVQERTDDTDAQCEAAKAAWDALTDAQKELVEGEEADPDYFGRDTGDASKDDPRNEDNIGDNELLVVSFGHNDANRAKAERYVPADAFGESLRPFWDAARSHGAVCIFASPVAMREFDEAGVCHPSFAAYREAMRAFAAEVGAPFIDLGAATAAANTAFGAERCKARYMWVGAKQDNAHQQNAGACRTAQAFVQQLLQDTTPALDVLRANFK